MVNSVNSVKDLLSMIRFLRITGGIELTEVFNRVITRRLGTSGGLAETLVQRLMQDICLRRKKDMKFVDLKLPEKKEFIHRIAFRPEEKKKYDTLLYVKLFLTSLSTLTPLYRDEARSALEIFQSGGDSYRGRFQNVLERLLRLRQL